MNANPVVRGAALMAASSVVFCVMGALIKFIPGVDICRTTLARFIVGVAVLCTAAMAGRIKLEFVNKPLLFCRGIVGGSAVFVAFWSISRLGIGMSTVLTYTYPVFAAILSAFMLRERLAMGQWACIVVSVFGMALLAGGGGSPDTTAVFIALAGAVLSGLAVVLVKKLHKTDTSYSIFFAQSLIGFWIMVVPANTVGGETGVGAAVIMVLVGMAAAGGQLLMTEAYHYVSATMGSLLSLMTPVLSLAAGVLFFGEAVTGWGFIGSGLIIVSCGAMVLMNSREGLRLGSVKSYLLPARTPRW